MKLKKEAYPYQEEAIDRKVKLISSKIRNFIDGISEESPAFCLNAPTGSGKTFMVADIIRRLGDPESGELASYGVRRSKSFSGLMFLVWAPNSLDKQLSQSLRGFGLDNDGTFTLKTLNDIYASPDSLEENDVLVCNYSSFNKEKNVSRKDNERGSNLDSQLASLRERGIEVVLVVDEAHVGFLSKISQDFMRDVVKPVSVLTVTATPELNKGKMVPGAESEATLTTVDRRKVVDSGVIVDKVLLNSGIEDYASFSSFSSNELFMHAAAERAQEMKGAYEEEGRKVNPLVGIQLSSNVKDPLEAGKTEIEKDSKQQKDEIEKALAWLEEHYDATVSNGKVAIKTSGRYENMDNIEDNDNEVDFIIFKAAIAVGWDCPRLKTMALLRNTTSKPFSIQTIGRAMRQPEHRKYDNDFLNMAYVFTENDLTRELIRSAEVEAAPKKRVVLDYENEEKQKTVELVQKFSGFPHYARLRVEHGNLTHGEVYPALKEVLEERGHDISKPLPVKGQMMRSLLNAVGMDDKKSKPNTTVQVGEIKESHGNEYEDLTINSERNEDDRNAEYLAIIRRAILNSDAVSHANNTLSLEASFRYAALGGPKKTLSKSKSGKNVAKVFEFADFRDRVLANRRNETAFESFMTEVATKAWNDSGKLRTTEVVDVAPKLWKPLETEYLPCKKSVEEETEQNRNYLYSAAPKDFSNLSGSSAGEQWFSETFISELKDKLESKSGEYVDTDLLFMKNGVSSAMYFGLKYVNDKGGEKVDSLFFPDWIVFIRQDEKLFHLIIETKGHSNLWNERTHRPKAKALTAFVNEQKEEGLRVHGLMLNIVNKDKNQVQIALGDEETLETLTAEDAADKIIGDLISQK